METRWVHNNTQQVKYGSLRVLNYDWARVRVKR